MNAEQSGVTHLNHDIATSTLQVKLYPYLTTANSFRADLPVVQHVMLFINLTANQACSNLPSDRAVAPLGHCFYTGW